MEQLMVDGNRGYVWIPKVQGHYASFVFHTKFNYDYTRNNRVDRQTRLKSVEQNTSLGSDQLQAEDKQGTVQALVRGLILWHAQRWAFDMKTEEQKMSLVRRRAVV